MFTVVEENLFRNSITNGSSSNIFSTNRLYKTYTSINEVYIFGTVINKVTIDIFKCKRYYKWFIAKVEAYNIDGTKESFEYKTSTEKWTE